MELREESTNLSTKSRSTNVSLVVLMGLPASGKSTLAKKLANYFSPTWGVVVVSFDDFISVPIQGQLIQQLLVSGDKSEQPNSNQNVNDDKSTAKILRKKFVTCVDVLLELSNEICNSINGQSSPENSLRLCEKYVQILKTSLGSTEPSSLVSDYDFVSKMELVIQNTLQASRAERLVIVVDDNNYYHSMRNDFYQIAKASEIGFCVVFCKTSLKICLQRNSERGVDFQVPSTAIEEMHVKLEEPNPLKNPCDIYCVQIDTDLKEGESHESFPLNFSLLEQVISSTLCNPLTKGEDRTEEIERERRICSENEVHQADLLLRKWVTKKLNLGSLARGLGPKQEGDSSRIFKKNLSSDLNLRKKRTLEKLRSGELKVSYSVLEDVEFRQEIIEMFENISL